MDEVMSAAFPSSIGNAANVQEFPVEPLADTRGLLMHVVLSLWDNILGPQVLQVWSANEAAKCQSVSSVLKFVSRLILSGEACPDDRLNFVDSKVYMIEDGSLVAAGYVFSGRSKYDVATYCLAAIFPLQKLRSYIDWHEVIDCHLRKAVQMFRAWLHKEEPLESSISCLQQSIDTLTSLLAFLQDCSLPMAIKMEDTLFCLPMTSDERETTATTSVSTLSGRRRSSSEEVTLLQLSVYAHLCMFGKTVVLGHASADVDKMVQTLSLFCLAGDRRRCCLLRRPLEPAASVQSESSRYVPELHVQGLLLAKNAEDQDATLMLLARDILRGRSPVAIVNLSRGQVLQSATYDDHAAMHLQSTREELSVALERRPLATDAMRASVVRAASNYVSAVKRPSEKSHFSAFFRELLKLPNAGHARENYIAQYIHLLEKKACAVIKYIKTEISHGSQPRMADLVTDLLLAECDDDLRLVVSTAERLQPGSCAVVLRAPRDAFRSVHDAL